MPVGFSVSDTTLFHLHSGFGTGPGPGPTNTLAQPLVHQVAVWWHATESYPFICGGVLTAKRAAGGEVKSPVTGTIGVPEVCEKVCMFMGDAVFLEDILRIIGVYPRGKDGTSGQQRGCELAEITNVTNMAGAWPTSSQVRQIGVSFGNRKRQVSRCVK